MSEELRPDPGKTVDLYLEKAHGIEMRVLALGKDCEHWKTKVLWAIVILAAGLFGRLLFTLFTKPS